MTYSKTFWPIKCQSQLGLTEANHQDQIDTGLSQKRQVNAVNAEPRVNCDLPRILVGPGTVSLSSGCLITVTTRFSLFTPVCPLRVVLGGTWTRQAPPNSIGIVDLVVGEGKVSCDSNPENRKTLHASPYRLDFFQKDSKGTKRQAKITT